MPPRRALVFGASGQDGSYLCELLAAKGYAVWGAARRAPSAAGVRPLAADVRDAAAVDAAVAEAAPDEVYNLAGTTSVPETWDDPLGAADATALGPLRILEALRRRAPAARFFQASSAQVFGDDAAAPQDELTPVRPSNPYGAAKAYADAMVRAYRERHGLFACSGILFNHESPRRGARFVTTRVCEGAALAKAGRLAVLELEDLSTARDWGFAGDFVEAMWLMLQRPEPDDFVLATGRARTVAELAEAAFAAAGLDWRAHVREAVAGPRPGEAARSVGNPAKALRALGWAPRTSFEAMVAEMVRAAAARAGGAP